MRRTVLTLLAAAMALSLSAAEPASPRKTASRGHEYVDMGLSVCWATCNVGAASPEKAGGYYSWGESELKDTCTVWNYRWCEGFYWNEKFTKYGSVDGIYTLTDADDAARTAWGGKWRTPTHEEQEELSNRCTWTWTVDYKGTGVNGCVVTSKVPGYENRSIFIPAVGDKLGDKIRSYGARGFYMSSTMIPDFDQGACNILFEHDKVVWMYSYRYYGLQIRPVLVK